MAQILSASANGDADGVRQLVQFMGVPPSFANGMGQTALHISSLWGHAEVVRTLLDLKANVHARNRLRSFTPLHQAVCGRGPEKGRAECVRLLLGARADPSAVDDDGKKAVDLADGEVREALGAPALLLHKAVEVREEQALVDGMRKIKDGSCSLHLDETDASGTTALHLAVFLAWRKGAELLLAAGASPSTRTLRGETPLHTVVQRGDHLLLGELLEDRADVNVQDEDREMDPRFSSTTFQQDPSRHRSPLHYAAQRRNSLAISRLLSHRADPNLQDSQRRTPLHLAVEAKCDDGDLELGCGVRVKGAKNAALNGCIGSIVGRRARPKEKGYGTVSQDPGEFIVLVDGQHVQLQASCLQPLCDEAVQALISARADINLGNHIIGESCTLLHEAARQGDGPLVKMLLEARASVDQQEQKQGFSALHLAARSKRQEVCRLLVAARADLSSKSRSGATAAELAKKNGCVSELVTLLRGEDGSGGEAARETAAEVKAKPQTLADLTPEQRAMLFMD